GFGSADLFDEASHALGGADVGLGGHRPGAGLACVPVVVHGLVRGVNQHSVTRQLGETVGQVDLVKIQRKHFELVHREQTAFSSPACTEFHVPDELGRAGEDVHHNVQISQPGDPGVRVG